MADMINGTNYSQIYCEFDLQHEDKLQLLPLPDKLKIYETYLKYAIGYFKDDCYKDLSNRTDYWQYEYDFICDGIETQFQLSPFPSEECNIYIGYRESSDDYYKEIVEYTYDSETGIITLPVAPKCNLDLEVITYIDGKFNVDLDETEINILVSGMIASFNIKQLEKETLMRFSVYGGSTKAFSKAEHLKAVSEIKKNALEEMKSLINAYTFKRSPDRLYSLGGREYMYAPPTMNGGGN